MGFSPLRLAETFGVGEIPSGNAYGNARGLATIGAAMANRGVFRGTKVWSSVEIDLHFNFFIFYSQVMSDQGWTALHDEIKKDDLWGWEFI